MVCDSVLIYLKKKNIYQEKLPKLLCHYAVQALLILYKKYFKNFYTYIVIIFFIYIKLSLSYALCTSIKLLKISLTHQTRIDRPK